MGLFDQIKNVVSPQEAEASEENMIKVYDEYGREMLISKEAWRKNVLPDNLKKSWNNPDELYQHIVIALRDEHFSDVLKASEQFLKIDKDKERGHVIRGIVLQKNGKLKEAKEVYEKYIKEYGETGYILTNYAKIFADEGNQEKVEEILWKGLEIDPNQSNGIDWWIAIHNERGGKETYLAELRKLEKIQGSWRPQLWLAREALENKDLETAKKYYADIVSKAKDVPEVLMSISGDLGRAGYLNEIFDIVLPIYDPQKHDMYVGLNILQAYLETKRFDEGKEFLKKMFALNLPYLRENLMFYSNKFAEGGTDLPKKIDKEEKLTVEIVSLDKPIFSYGLKDAKWLLPDVKRDGPKIGFMPLAKLDVSELDSTIIQQEDDIGRMTRSIPLYFIENFYFETNSTSQVFMPLFKDGGLITSGTEYDVEYFLQVISKSEQPLEFDYFVCGNIKKSDNGYNLELSIWDVESKTKVNTISQKSTSLEGMGPTVKDILGQLKGYFEKKNNFSKVKPIDYYRLLDGSLVNMQLLQYGQAFVLVATDNEYIKKETMYGERGMLRNSLDLALDVKDVLIPKALFVSNLAKAYSYKSDILPEFKDYAVKFLQDNRNDKYVVMLSPLVYKIFGMEQEFADFEETIGTYSDSYQEWFKKLKDI